MSLSHHRCLPPSRRKLSGTTAMNFFVPENERQSYVHTEADGYASGRYAGSSPRGRARLKLCLVSQGDAPCASLTWRAMRFFCSVFASAMKPADAMTHLSDLWEQRTLGISSVYAITQIRPPWTHSAHPQLSSNAFRASGPRQMLREARTKQTLKYVVATEH